MPFNNSQEVENLLFLEMNQERNLGNHVLSKLTFDIIKSYKK